MWCVCVGGEMKTRGRERDRKRMELVIVCLYRWTARCMYGIVWHGIVSRMDGDNPKLTENELEGSSPGMLRDTLNVVSLPGQNRKWQHRSAG